MTILTLKILNFSQILEEALIKDAEAGLQDEEMNQAENVEHPVTDGRDIAVKKLS
ncbi:hypothetical protein F2Q69_00054091 [Brassica cretica]|uniref:Uncharacterized protein n=1 Tax=Brassica cretica TaxID=69181 RepID=A0A8S9MSK9_BRACR|nr:hypothetical protein F2Q69_00054091 [Brassica cretica]